MIAIYARKSVFREDSISIESQIEMCRYEAKGAECVVYSDNGFSGKNTDRPEYQRMIEDIKDKKIDKVIVYKLDRISRSILDFSNMMNLFQKLNVAFISATEHFDTSSPMGRAMLNICIVFAQLERETIQQRVADAYSSRSKKGFYMGGKIPYGYTKVPIVINGVRTSMYEPVETEADDIRLIYSIYSKPSATLGDVLRELVKRGINVNRRGKSWNTARLSELMRNPVYTCADSNIYEFFKEQKSNIINPISDFTGETSLYLFKGENTNRKSWDLSNQNLVVAPHSAIIDSTTWLTCRRKLLGNHQIKTCKPKNSFLAGLIKCGHCGYAMTVAKSARSGGRYVKYFIDSGKTNHCCSSNVTALRVDDFEQEVVERIKNKLDSLTIQKKSHDNTFDNHIAELLARKEEVEKEIENVLNTLTTTTNKLTISYIEKKIEELDSQKQNIEQQISDAERENKDKNVNHKQLHDVMSKWDELSFDDKRSVVNLLIQRITVYNDHVEITWRV